MLNNKPLKFCSNIRNFSGEHNSVVVFYKFRAIFCFSFEIFRLENVSSFFGEANTLIIHAGFEVWVDIILRRGGNCEKNMHLIRKMKISVTLLRQSNINFGSKN